MNYKNQKRYLDKEVLPEIRQALIELRDQNVIHGRYVNTKVVSDHIISNPQKFSLATKGRKHIHEGVGVFITEKVRDSEPYNKRARTCGGRTYFLPHGVESIR